MKKLIRGIQEFQDHHFDEYRDLFGQLAHGQKPKVLFITCSDSRIVPTLLTQTDPGEMFVIRNAGNIVPPYGAANGGEGATIEYAVHALGINQVVICGHSHCGAMKGLLKLNQLRESMPLVCKWLEHAAGTLRVLQDSYGHLEGEDLIETAVAENVLTQIENLQTYPVIHSRLHQGKMQIHGWIYEFETGDVLAYDPEAHAFLPPSTQLVEKDGDGSITPGHYVSTSGPPVEDIGGHGMAATAKNRAAPWLSPEQASRIYQGNGVRR
jgi:carbonic anhydrase